MKSNSSGATRADTDVNADRSSSTRSERVFDVLRQEILSGELAPGTQLRQVEIAARLGVSTTPVREAFATLAQEGLVLKDSHRGVVVFEPSREELNEIYEIRLALEPLATSLACPRMAEVDLDELDAIIDRMRASKDRVEREQLNREFHAAIYARAHRTRLSAIIDQCRDTAAAYLRFLARNSEGTPYRTAADAEHSRIVEALRRRDGPAAAEAMRDHLAHSQQHIEGVILGG